MSYKTKDITKLVEKTNQFQSTIGSGEYGERAEKAVSSLQSLGNELNEAKRQHCLDNGYTEIIVAETEHAYLAPERMPKRQFKQIVSRVPENLPHQARLFYFVESEVLNGSQHTDEYRELVRRRQEVLDSIVTIIEEFASEHLSDLSTEERVVAVYAVFGINFDSPIISKALDCDEETVKKYDLQDGVVVRY